MAFTKTQKGVSTFRYFTTDEDGMYLTARSQDLWRERTGDANSRWKQQVQDHQNASTVMSGLIETSKSLAGGGFKTVVNVNRPTGFQTFKVNGKLSCVQYPLAFHGTFVDDTAAYGQALTRALAQINKSNTAFQGGTFLGELGESLKMLRRPAQGLRKAIKEKYLDRIKKVPKGQMRKKDPNLDRWKEALSQTWLEANFGWRPLIQDLQEASNAYNRLYEKRDRLVKFKGKGAIPDQEIYQSEDLWAPISDFYWNSSVREYVGAKAIVRGQMLFRAEMTPLEKAELFGFSPGQFIPTAWNLLPWSFLLDYFSNIGDILENGVTDTRNVAWACTSRINYLRKEISTWTSKNLASNSNAVSIGGSPDRSMYQRKTVSRYPEHFDALPKLRFELPGSPIKQFNMLALWTQANTIHPQSMRSLGRRGLPSA